MQSFHPVTPNQKHLSLSIVESGTAGGRCGNDRNTEIQEERAKFGSRAETSGETEGDMTGLGRSLGCEWAVESGEC